jgi:hypothetical protein
MFLRIRTREGIRPFQLTDADKAQLKQVRSGVAIQRLLGAFLGNLGLLACFAGITYPFYAGEHPDSKWQDAIECFVIGIFLLFCAWLLLRRFKR